MRQRGFTLHTEGRLTYWYHPGDADAAAAEAGACAAAAGKSDEEVAAASAEARAAKAAAAKSGKDRRPPPKELTESGRGAPASDAADGPAPLVFVHGVGLGPLPYFNMIDEMLSGV